VEGAPEVDESVSRNGLFEIVKRRVFLAQALLGWGALMMRGSLAMGNFSSLSATSKRKVLIVDDQEMVRAVIKTILEEFGHWTGIQAASNKEALATLHAVKPDLITTDVSRDGCGDGIQFLEALKTYHPEVPVLVVSGNGEPDVPNRCLELGAYAFLPKPFTVADLLSVVKVRAVSHDRIAAKLMTAPAAPKLPSQFPLKNPLITSANGLKLSCARRSLGVRLSAVMVAATGDLRRSPQHFLSACVASLRSVLQNRGGLSVLVSAPPRGFNRCRPPKA
jgi:CheY-like chemotaxis protein